LTENPARYRTIPHGWAFWPTLAAAKARGVRLGRPDRETRHMHAAKSAKVAAFRATVLPEVRRLIGGDVAAQDRGGAEPPRPQDVCGPALAVQHVSSLLAAGSGAPT